MLWPATPRALGRAAKVAGLDADSGSGFGRAPRGAATSASRPLRASLPKSLSGHAAVAAEPGFGAPPGSGATPSHEAAPADVEHEAHETHQAQAEREQVDQPEAVHALGDARRQHQVLAQDPCAGQRQGLPSAPGSCPECLRSVAPHLRRTVSHGVTCTPLTRFMPRMPPRSFACKHMPLTGFNAGSPAASASCPERVRCAPPSSHPQWSPCVLFLACQEVP